MATTAPPVETTKARPATQPLRIPPEEAMWVKYSPHGEAPLSFVGSLAVHVGVVVLLLLFGWLAYWLFKPPVHDLPVTMIRMPGGGGGSRTGQGDAPGIGEGPAEDPNGDDKSDPTASTPEPVKAPPLTVKEAAAIDAKFADDPAARVNVESGNENLKKVARLAKELRVGDGVTPGKGQGGAGKGGGQGLGDGTGTGSGSGNSSAPLTSREKRMLRWAMAFSTRNGHDYLEQLRDLGAVIAIPSNQGGKKYQTCDLSKSPPRWTDDDLEGNTKIFWIDDKPSSVQSLLGALGVRGYPTHFVALMPEKLETRLYNLERDYKHLDEDQIFETTFECFRDPRTGKNDVRVRSQKQK
jgi:hypothetical protein